MLFKLLALKCYLIHRSKAPLSKFVLRCEVVCGFKYYTEIKYWQLYILIFHFIFMVVMVNASTVS